MQKLLAWKYIILEHFYLPNVKICAYFMLQGLEYCEERYTLDLSGGLFPLRGQTSSTKLLGCQSIERFPSHGDREESMREGWLKVLLIFCVMT